MGLDGSSISLFLDKPIYQVHMSLLLCLEPFQKFAVGGGGCWWSKVTLKFRFGPNLGLRLEAGTKLNNINAIEYVVVGGRPWL